MRYLLLFTCVLILFAPKVDAVSNWEVTSFENVEFFPQNVINAIAQDQNGSIWLGTWGQGVWKLNESGTRHYDPAKLHYDDCVNSLTHDDNGNLWVATSNGWAFFNGQTWHSGSIPNMPGYAIQCLELMQDGKLWIGASGNLFSLNPDDTGIPENAHWTQILNESQTNGETIDDIIQCKNGDVWVSVNDYGLWRYRDEEWAFYDWKSSLELSFVEDDQGQLWAVGGDLWLEWQEDHWVEQDVPFSNITCAAIVGTNQFFAGTEKGLWIKNGNQWESYSLQNNQSSVHIECIFPQNDNIVWIGTRVGFYRMAQSSWNKFLSDIDWVNNFFEATLNHVPIVLSEHGQIYRFDDSSFIKVEGSINSIENIYDAVFSDHYLWIINHQYLYKLDQQYQIVQQFQLPADFAAHSILVDGLNRVWFYGSRSVYQLTNEGRIETILQLPEGFQRHIMTMAWIENQDLWLGMDLGLARLSEGKFSWFREITPLNDRKIRTIYHDHQEQWWFGTSVAGAFVWKEGEDWTQYSTRNGLSNNYVSAIYESSNNTIWLGSRNGHVTSFRDGRWIQYHQDSIHELSIINTITESPAGTIWFYSKTNGIAAYQADQNPPNTFFEIAPQEISNNSSGIFSVKGIDTWNKTPVNMLEFSWRILDEAERIIQPWSVLSKNNIFNLPVLTSGNYFLEVRSEDFDRNPDPTPIRTAFIVTPPIWMRQQFYIPVTILTIIILFLMWKRHHAVRALSLSEEKYRTLVENAQTLVLKRKVDGTVTFWSECGTYLMGIDKENLENTHAKESIFKNAHKKPACLLEQWGEKVNEYKCGFQCETANHDLNGDDVWISWNCQPIFNSDGAVTELLKVGVDVTQRKQAEIARDQLIDDLTNAINEVKTLSGLLPICASCKKIRDDQGYWNRLEEYITKHSQAQFSHGICPDCARALYPDHYDE